MARGFWLLLLVILCAVGARGKWLIAQTGDEATQAAEKATAEKFLQLLIKRPQPGTALNKTVEHYQSTGQLERLVGQLKATAEELQLQQPEASARHWLALGFIAQSQSRWLESIDLLGRAPEVPEHRWAIATAQSIAMEQLQRWPAIIEQLQPIIEQEFDGARRTNPESLIDAARRLAKAYARQGNSAEALKVWRMLEQRFRGDKPIATRLVNMAADEGELEFAVELLDRLLAGLPPSTQRVELSVLRTSMVARMGQQADAIASYQELLRGLNADSWLANDVMRRIEELVVDKEGNDGLIAYYQKQIEQQPDQLSVILRLAAVLDREQRWDESAPLYKQLIERTTTAIEPRLAYAQSLAHQEQWSAAAREFAKLIELAPRNEDFVLQWCEAIQSDDSIDATERNRQLQSKLEQALLSSAPSAANYQMLAARLQRFDQSQAAAAWLAKAYELQPDDLSVVADYSRALVQQGREPEMLPILTTYEKAHLRDREALTQLSDLMADLGLADASIDCLSRACKLGASSAMRYRLSEWFEKSGNITDAVEQLELAWNEISQQTKSIIEQESLCEEIARRHIQLLLRAGLLHSATEKLSNQLSTVNERVDNKNEVKNDVADNGLAGLTEPSVNRWRLARFLVADNQRTLARQQLQIALSRNANSVMLWRLQAEIDQHEGKLTEALADYEKLAELDARKRSEHLLAAAKILFRSKKTDAALKLTEAITTETASSLHVIEVFDLALECEAVSFALDLLEKRLQARPGDRDVLQRLIRYYSDTGAVHRAAEYLWKSLEVMRTPDERLRVVTQLIDLHANSRSLESLDEQLQKFGRERDAWREYSVWQTMIALQSRDVARAQTLLDRLVQSPATRRFALQHLLELAVRQKLGTKQLELLKQLAAVDARSITTESIIHALGELPKEQRTLSVVADALSLAKGADQRLALIEDSIHGGDVDGTLQMLDLLPASDQGRWPIVARSALLWAALPFDRELTLPHVQHAANRMSVFVEGSLELSDKSFGQRLLDELLNSQQLITDFFATATVSRHGYASDSLPGSGMTRCFSPLQAYAVVLAAHLQSVSEPDERRAVLERHRAAALRQTSQREQVARLAAIALVSYWHSKTPTIEDFLDKNRETNSPRDARGLFASITRLQQAGLLSLTASAVDRLSFAGDAFQIVAAELRELADHGDSLASLLSLWDLANSRIDLLKPDQVDSLHFAIKISQNLGDCEAYAPSQVLTSIAIARLRDGSQSHAEQQRQFARLSTDLPELTRVIELALENDDIQVMEAVIDSQPNTANLADLLGVVACSRTNRESIDAVDLWPALDYLWQREVQSGRRQLERLQFVRTDINTAWARTLPVCDVSMHESSMFHQLDFYLVRAIVARAQSDASKQDLLKVIQQRASTPAQTDLLLVRQLAHAFVLELLEQDPQSEKALDAALPPEAIATSPGAVVLRGLWLDVIGRRESAIEWWLKFRQWPQSCPPDVAAHLLEVALERHVDAAIDLAIENWDPHRSSTIESRSMVAELIRRDKLAHAERVLGEFDVLLPPVSQAVSAKLPQTLTLPLDLSQRVRWEQTELLFRLLGKYAAADDQAAAFRVGHRLLTCANHASDFELREHLPNLVERLDRSFKNAAQLKAFLESESQHVEKDTSPREALCLLRLMGRGNHVALAQALIDKMAVRELSSVENFEIAQTWVQLNQPESAAKFFVRTFEREPLWLEESIAQIDGGQLVFEQLWQELNRNPKAAVGFGRASAETFLRWQTIGKLQNFPNLWLAWASNSSPKTFIHLQTVLPGLRRTNFELWLAVVERLLLNDELPPMVLAFDDPNHKTERAAKPLGTHGTLENNLMQNGLNEQQEVEYRAMLERVLAKSRHQFVARLLLMNSLLLSQRFAQAQEQLDTLLQNAAARSPTKIWLNDQWQSAASLVQARRSSIAGVTQPPLSNKTFDEVDKAAKGLLIFHLIDNWDPTVNPSSNRYELLEQAAEFLGVDQLPLALHAELLQYMVSLQDEVKLARFLALELTDKFSLDLRAPRPGQLERLSQLFSYLGEKGMSREQHWLLVRAAQRLRVPLQDTMAYQAQRGVDPITKQEIRFEITYPTKQATQSQLLQLLEDCRQKLANVDMHSTNEHDWSDVYKPCLAIDSQSFIQTVSMLDAIWPLDIELDDASRKAASAAVATWSHDLEALGPWQTLALHNVAARLQDAGLVQRAQQRLYELSQQQANKNDETWRDATWHQACWSAVQASKQIAGTESGRLRLGEIARNAVSKMGQDHHALYVAMTIDQLDAVLGDRQSAVQDAAVLDKLATDAITFAIRAPVNRAATEEAQLARLQINLRLFEKLMSLNESSLSLDMLLTMRRDGLIEGHGAGIMPVLFLTGRPFRRQTLNVQPLFQKLIDSGMELEKLRRLLNELLLENYINWRTPGFAAPDTALNSKATPTEKISTLKFEPEFDHTRPLDRVEIPPNLFDQLVQVSQLTDSMRGLQAICEQAPQKRAAHYVCGGLAALREGEPMKALSIYRKATLEVNRATTNEADLSVLRDSIFNAVVNEPLGEAALEYSSIALDRSVNNELVKLLRRQLSLAPLQNKIADVANIVMKIKLSVELESEVRHGLINQYARGLLDASLVKQSFDAYAQGGPVLDHRISPNLYVTELMNRLPSMSDADQATLFECFVSGKYQSFPWLTCYELPVQEPLPERFRRPETRQGLVFQALDQRRSWVCPIQWIADYAKRTGRTEAALQAAAMQVDTQQAANVTNASWGAAALAAQLDPHFTSEELKKRLNSATQQPASPASMRALLDSCQNNEELRSAAVEHILNLGNVDIALSSARPAESTPSPKHWLILRETTMVKTHDTQPKWSLSKSGLFTAQRCRDAWYLMLRYPIADDFSLSMKAVQRSGAKFGIGYGGISVAQPSNDRVLRCLGFGQRQALGPASGEPLDNTEVDLQVQRQQSQWSLAVATVRAEETAADVVPFVYLVNQGEGTAFIDDWKLSQELKIAPHVNLLDEQMRMWRTTVGSWSLPALDFRNDNAQRDALPICHVTQDGVLNLTAPKAASSTKKFPGGALHCVRPLQVDESLEYEFYAAEKTAIVHPALGRMIMRLDDSHVKLQWLTDEDELPWLGVKSDQLFELETKESVAAIAIQPDAWNKVTMRLSTDHELSIELNNQPIARFALPTSITPEIGLSVTSELPAKVRQVRLSGNWPRTLSLEQLKE